MAPGAKITVTLASDLNKKTAADYGVLLPDLLGWSFVADAVAAASTFWSVRRNGSAVGTLTWAAAGTVPTLATTGGAAQPFAIDDFFDVVAAASADLTLADVSGTIMLVRG